MYGGVCCGPSQVRDKSDPSKYVVFVQDKRYITCVVLHCIDMSSVSHCLLALMEHSLEEKK